VLPAHPQSFFAIQAGKFASVHRLALALQQHMQSPIAIAWSARNSSSFRAAGIAMAPPRSGSCCDPTPAASGPSFAQPFSCSTNDLPNLQAPAVFPITVQRFPVQTQIGTRCSVADFLISNASTVVPRHFHPAILRLPAIERRALIHAPGTDPLSSLRPSCCFK